MEERLQKFVKLVDAGNFTRAAASMRLSQPALSTAIKKLERELRAQLLIRGSHAFSLTAAGEAAYAAGKELAARHANLRQQLSALGEQKVPIAIGMIDSIAELLFVHAGELAALEEWAQVSLSINNSGALLRAVLRHDLDVAIIAEQPALAKTLRVQILGSEPLMVVARADAGAFANQCARRGELADFLSYNQASTTHELVQAAAGREGVGLQPSFYSTSPEIMLKLVLAGRGTAALPYLMVRDYADSQALVPVFLGASCVIERHIIAVQHASRHLPAECGATLQRTRAQLRTLLAGARQLQKQKRPDA